MSRVVYIDRTHVRGHVTGIERVALDLFAPERLSPHDVRALTSGSVAGMVAAQQVGLPLRALLEREALFVFPGFPPSPLMAAAARRAVIYVHDTFLLDRPEDLSPRSRLYMAPGFARAVRWGRVFLVNSLATGRALRAVCAPEALVEPLRPAVRDVFGLGGLQPAAWRPGEPLRLLALGTVEPRKNYPAALALVAALNRGGLAAELHVVGRVGWGRHAFLDDPPPFLTLHGYVEDAALRRLARTCHALLSTSKAEGLGLPLLEIQHGGLPVVAPEGEVFHEVLGGTGLHIRPDAPEDAARRVADWAAAGALTAAGGRSRRNVARWNALAAQDAERFRAFLDLGPAAYAADGQA